MLTDELANLRLREAIETLRISFEAARERGDSAYYVRPELAWVVLEAADSVAGMTEECMAARMIVWNLVTRLGGSTVITNEDLDNCDGALLRREPSETGVRLIALPAEGTQSKGDLPPK